MNANDVTNELNARFLSDQLTVKWGAVRCARTPEEVTDAEKGVALFFKRNVQQTRGSLFSAVLHADVTEKDKLRICEIAAQALFENVAPASNQKDIEEAIWKFKGYTKTSETFSQELNCAHTAFSKLPTCLRTPEMLSQVLEFFEGQEKEQAAQFLLEIETFPEELLADYFLYRRNQELRLTLKLIETEKREALRILVPTLRGLNNDECRMRTFRQTVALIPAQERMQVLELLSFAYQYIRTQRNAGVFHKIMEDGIQENDRTAFLKTLEPLIREKCVSDLCVNELVLSEDSDDEDLKDEAKIWALLIKTAQKIFQGIAKRDMSENEEVELKTQLKEGSFVFLVVKLAMKARPSVSTEEDPARPLVPPIGMGIPGTISCKEK